MAKLSQNQTNAVDALRLIVSHPDNVDSPKPRYADLVAWKKSAKDTNGATVTVQSLVKEEAVKEKLVAVGARIVKVYRPKS